MNAPLPKQFLLLNGKPLIMHTLEVFRLYDPHIKIRLVLPEDQFGLWENLCDKYGFSMKHDLGTGGETRFHSVKKNLSFVTDKGLVAVHDGVRPLVSLDTIERCYKGAEEYGNAVPGIKIPETLRIIRNDGSVQTDRSLYRLIQTPQVFRGEVLKKAYLQEYNSMFTDDAGVVENAGFKINLVEGNPENIKVTLPNDLVIAEALVRCQNGFRDYTVQQ